MRIRLDLPDGQIAAVQTFGDYLGFHPHIYILGATGFIDKDNRFHLLPVKKRRGAERFWTKAEPEPAGRANQNIEGLTELFRHRFIQTLLDEKLISQKKARQLLAWKQIRLETLVRVRCERKKSSVAEFAKNSATEGFTAWIRICATIPFVLRVPDSTRPNPLRRNF